MNIKLIAPKESTWWLAVFLAIAGFILKLNIFKIASLETYADYAFWLMAVAFLLVTLSSTDTRGL